ncbi:hypothetical protein ACPA9J_26440 [Pseudomonas aeruginosa]
MPGIALERLAHSAALQRLEPREALRELIGNTSRRLLALLFEQNPGRQAGHGDAGRWQSYVRSPGRLLPARSRSVCFVSISARRPSATLHRLIWHRYVQAPRSRGPVPGCPPRLEEHDHALARRPPHNLPP